MGNKKETEFLASWTAEDRTKMARRVLQMFPERQFQTAKKPAALDISAVEFRAAMRKALPAERHHPINHLPSIRECLFDGLRELAKRDPDFFIAPTPTPARSARSTSPTYSGDDYVAIARKLVELYPDNNFMARESMAALRIAQANAALVAAIPAERAVRFKSLTLERPRLTAAFDVLREQKEQAEAAARQEAQQREQERRAEAAAEAERKTQRRVFWRDERVLVARQLHQDNPDARWPWSTTLDGLKPQDVMHAQRSLPEDRRRDVNTMSMVRNLLLEGFKVVRAELEAEEAARVKAEAQAAAEAAMREAQRKAAEAMEAAANLPPPPNEWENAFKPMVQLVAREFAQAFAAVSAPMIQQAFAAALTAALPQASAVQVAKGEDKPAPAERTVDQLVSYVRPPKVAIVGALPQQGEMIKNSYPQLAVKVVDKNLTSSALRDAVAGCDKVLAMIDFISHPMYHAVRKAAGDRFVYVNGGVSAVRHQLDVWLHNGALAPQMAAH